VVAAKDRFLDQVESLARHGDGDDGPMFSWVSLSELRQRLADMARQVSEACAEAGREPADLAPPSRRAYQLMNFLASGRRLEDHLHTLGRLDGADQRIRVRLDHTGSLYRIERREDVIRLSASEGFVGAPEPVLQALVRLAVPHARKQVPRRLVQAFSESSGYTSVLREVESSGGAYRSRPGGIHHDLAEVFDAVNRGYFGGRLEPPRLLWSERVPSVEFGHYEPATDTVRLSRRLDAADVPRFVLEHVMHHELLHRVLGAEPAGRRRFHTPRFRRAERRFAAYREAEAFLQELAQHPVRRRRSRGRG
jgi:hypothetical protein